MSTEKKLFSRRPELWGGIECTINRIGNRFNDQLSSAGHYKRGDDIEKIASLDIKMLRYPVLWERHQPDEKGTINWDWTEAQLRKITASGITPIAGLLHHGSGPAHTSLNNENFPIQLAEYAGKVARQFPWLEYYTPVNEPLTTARFSGLYGFWYPHLSDDFSFLKMLINQVKGVVLSMQNIRKVNPAAKLVQTEDLAFSSSTRLLRYQANFENQRRWLTYDLLCGKVNKGHPLWKYLLKHGVTAAELLFFTKHPCPPDIMGLNYYVTSERWLDQDLKKYPACTHGGNAVHKYADTEAVRYTKPKGVSFLLNETWQRYKLPLAITECHLNCSREEQLRWFKETWDTCCKLAKSGVNVKAVTAWSLMGAFDWGSLLTLDNGHYEPGVFELRNNQLRSTALVKMIRSLAAGEKYDHPLTQQPGWWHRTKNQRNKMLHKKVSPLLIVGKNGTLANAFINVAGQRSIPHVALARTELNMSDTGAVEQAMELHKPWAMINATGFVRVDEAETNRAECFRVNAEGPANLARACRQKGVPFMTFSSDLVFDGSKNAPYLEADHVHSLNVYGASKARGEELVKINHPGSLIIRTSGFFGPWDKYNFVHNVLATVRNGQRFAAANDIYSSPTYVPDLVNYALDLFIDEESGIWHITNDGVISWAEFAAQVAERGGCKSSQVEAVHSSFLNWKAKRPSYSALQSDKGVKLPSLENAIDRYFIEQPL